MGNTITHKIYLHLYSLVILSAILLGNTLYMFFDDGFISSYQPDMPEQYHAADRAIRDYLTIRSDSLDTDILNDKEKTHLADVRNLFLGCVLVFLLMLACMLIFFNKQDIQEIAGTLPYYSLGLIVVVALLVAHFNTLFILFHRIFFRNDLWMMTPDDKIIILYPGYFFMNAATSIILRTITISVMVSVIVLVWKKKGIHNRFS